MSNDGYYLIDTGIFMKAKHLIQILETNEFALSDLKMFILTHCHCDHIGGAAELVRHSGVKLAAHKSDDWYPLEVQCKYWPVLIDAKKLLNYPIKYALFGHGAPITKNANQILTKSLGK